MLAHIAQRALEELRFARMTLTGQILVEDLPPVPQVGHEADRRRVIAVAVIDRLGSLLAEVANITEESNRLVYDLAEGLELRRPPPVEVEKKVFGFAAFRRAA